MVSKQLVWVISLLVASTACSGGSKSPRAIADPPSPSPTEAPLSFYASEYQRITAPGNVAAASLEAKIKANSNLTPVEIIKLAKPFIAIDKRIAQALLDAPWPATIEADMKAAVTANLGLIAALENLRSHSYMADVGTAGERLVEAVNAVRADLGLPPKGDALAA